MGVRHSWLVAVAVLLGAMPASELPAATMTARSRPAQELRQQWRDFWAAGRNRWSTTDPLPRFPSLRLISNPDGTLRDNPLVDSIDWRRSRNSSQFDRRYYRISPLFQRQDARIAAAEVRQYLVTISLPRTASFQILIPPDDATVAEPNLAEQKLSAGIDPVPVPEPASLTACGLLFAAAVWHRRRAGRHQRA